MTDEAVQGQVLVQGRITGSELEQVVKAFGLGQAHRVMFLPSGMMNRNWCLETSEGVFALKEIADVPVPKARRSLNVLQALAAGGLPVCAPHLTASADTVAEIDGRSYCLLPWAVGSHRAGTELDVGEAAELGALLGRIHRELAAPGTGLEPVVERPRAKVTRPEAATAEADRFLCAIVGLEVPEPFDIAAAEALERRKALIAAHAAQRPVDEVPRGPLGWTHGDFQPLNVLWEAGRVTAVLDWDRLAVRPYAEEVVRTVQVQFTVDDGRLDLERVSAFTAGYRSVVSIADEDLEDGVERLWWKRMTDFWQLQWHYDKNDHGPDRLWVSGERLLHWWSAHRDQVRAAFTTHP
ncbi:phosphotransferase [Streptosporangium amethystogenes]|uniref:phosphotransferase n=1 Tax=Streptosporangium amethystogenes TaxID=2002 RepID=UPI001B80B306|nr:phosphotransferase [Streptosporangium amethystogenes]